MNLSQQWRMNRKPSQWERMQRWKLGSSTQTWRTQTVREMWESHKHSHPCKEWGCWSSAGPTDWRPGGRSGCRYSWREASGRGTERGATSLCPASPHSLRCWRGRPGSAPALMLIFSPGDQYNSPPGSSAGSPLETGGKSYLHWAILDQKLILILNEVSELIVFRLSWILNINGP